MTRVSLVFALIALWGTACFEAQTDSADPGLDVIGDAGAVFDVHELPDSAAGTDLAVLSDSCTDASGAGFNDAYWSDVAVYQDAMAQDSTGGADSSTNSDVAALVDINGDVGQGNEWVVLDCERNNELPFGIMVNSGTLPGPEDLSVEGEAIVTYKGPAILARPGGWKEVEFTMAEQDATVLVAYQLAEDWEIPVQKGYSYDIKVLSRIGFEYLGVEVEIRHPGGDLVALIHDRPFDGDFVGTPCALESASCGQMQTGAVFVGNSSDGLGVGVGPGGILGFTDENLQPLRAVVVRAWHYATMDCVDVPWGWVSMAVFNNSQVSQCQCLDDYDCQSDEVCEPVLARCVPNMCVDVDSGKVECDPFVGVIEGRPEGRACLSDSDCGGGGLHEVCNSETARCQSDPCRDMECGDLQCSPFIGECVECLADCDCPEGSCDRHSWRCGLPCDYDKLGITQENSDHFDFYVACIPVFSGVDPSAILKAVDPSVSCGPNLHPACKGISEASCLGNLEFESSSKFISSAKWALICAVSQIPWVSGIQGGHWL